MNLVTRLITRLVFAIRSIESAHLGEKNRRQLGHLGQGTEIHDSVDYVKPSRIKIGNYVYIGPRCHLMGRGGLTIRDHSLIAPEVVIITSVYNYLEATMIPYDETEFLKPVEIGEACWVGMRAVILPGVTLGAGCIVFAGAVVTRSFPEGSILAGNPAKSVGRRDMEEFWSLHRQGRTYWKLKQETSLEKVERTAS